MTQIKPAGSVNRTGGSRMTEGQINCPAVSCPMVYGI